MKILIEVKPKSRIESVEKLNNGRYLVRVKAPRVKGKANKAVIKILRKHFDLPINIVSGHNSTLKVVEVGGL